MVMMRPGPNPESPGGGLVLFSIGGKRLAARTEEVAGVRVWSREIRIPSRTPYVNRLLRYGREVLPIYDLAARLNVSIVGTPALCLIAKHIRGPMAICIDADLPFLRHEGEWQVSSSSAETEVLGMYRLGFEDIPVYSLATLGTQARPELAKS
jgi:hypothetical protein